MDNDDLELSDRSGAEPVIDANRRMFEPPPVRLVTVNDAILHAAAGLERRLDAFYVTLLRFERDPNAPTPVYRAANFAIVFEIGEPPIARHGMRALGIEVQSLGTLEQQLSDAEIEFVMQRGLLPGDVSILLQDPAGNWIVVTEAANIR